MTDYAVVENVYDEEGEVKFTMTRLLLTNAPEQLAKSELKKMLSKVGEDFEWGICRVLPDYDWNDHHEFLGDAYQNGCLSLNYDDVLDQIGEERRLTLRLPSGLHTLVAKAASTRKVSINQFCINTLAETVGTEIEKERAQPSKLRSDKRGQDKG